MFASVAMMLTLGQRGWQISSGVRCRMATNPRSRSSKAALTPEDREAARETLPGRLLTRSTAFAVLIAGYLTAVGVVVRFFLSEFGTVREESPSLFWTILTLPLVVVVLFISFPEIWFKLQERRRRRLALTSTTTDPRNDYFRLDPYTTDSPADFKREDLAHEAAYDWIKASRRPILFMSGSSGSGKTSILASFVVPKLRSEGWRVQSLRTFGEPIVGLAEMLSSRSARSNRLLIILEQFEEFIILRERSAAAERESFLGLIREFRKNPSPNLTILIVVRSDYLKALIRMQLEEFSEKTWLEVDPFDHGAARRFLENSPRRPSSELVELLLEGLDAIDDAPGRFRPIALNMLGLALDQFEGKVTRRPERLIQDYLEAAIRQKDISDVVPAVLRHMISRRGVKVPGSLAELQERTGLTPEAVILCLNRLQVKRLVRRIDSPEDVWEISHDFVARQLGILMGRLRPSYWPMVATWSAPILLIVLLAGVVVTVPIYVRQNAFQELLATDVSIKGGNKKVVEFKNQFDGDTSKTLSRLALVGQIEYTRNELHQG